jgi:hypothetical protein
MICSQPYIKITRSIEVIKQSITEIEYHLKLFGDKIESDAHHFFIWEILDISYKSFSGPDGLLYLHTNQGVFPFFVKTNPEVFISEFKKLKNLESK